MRVCTPCKGQVQGGGARVRRRRRPAGGERTRLESGGALFAAAGDCVDEVRLLTRAAPNPLVSAVLRRIGTFRTRAGAATGRAGAPSDRAGTSPHRAGMSSDRAGTSARRAGPPSECAGRSRAARRLSSGRSGTSPRRAGMHPGRCGTFRTGPRRSVFDRSGAPRLSASPAILRPHCESACEAQLHSATVAVAANGSRGFTE